MTLDKRMEEWIRRGDRGISSEVIFETLSGNLLLDETWDFETPQDGSDFYRCYKLLNKIPEWRARLKEVSEKHPHWKIIVDHWQELETLLLKDLKSGESRELNRRLNQLNKYRYAPEKFPENPRPLGMVGTRGEPAGSPAGAVSEDSLKEKETRP